MKNKTIKSTLVILFVLSLSHVAAGQNLSSFLTTRIRQNVKARIEQTDNTKQSAPPASTGNSTSLVERSSAPDLLGFGLDVLNLSDVGGEKKTATPKTLTFSAYALKSMFTAEDPLDPEIYNRNKKLRSVSFTVGYDVPENTNERDPVVGIKWLAIDGRDVSSEKNKKAIDDVQIAVSTAGVSFNKVTRAVRLYLLQTLQTGNRLPPALATTDAFEGAVADSKQFQSFLSSLTGDEMKEIDAIISNHISAFVNLDAVSKQAVNSIRTKPQLALAFTTTQRRHGRPDEYNGVLTFDKGMGDNSISINGSFIIKKNLLGEDLRGGQLAAAIHLPLQALKPLGYTDPLLLSIEANATGMTKTAPIYKAQAKLTIPFLPGMEIPISVSVANRTEFVQEKEVKGKFGFTFDVSKAWKAFRDNFISLP
ncbi:MAG: hypothetical protein M3R69_09150 [Acidobacteriota bacterium]|nr:hypothetical protein [Acidobacteriota bacterium]